MSGRASAFHAASTASSAPLPTPSPAVPTNPFSKDSFRGASGSLRDDARQPAARLTREALLGAGFELHAEFSLLHTDLCRGWEGAPLKSSSVPLVSPSAEQFGAVAGWQLEERVAPPPAAAAAEGGEGGGGGGAPPAALSAPTSIPQPIVDRNTYAPYRWMFSPLHERAEALEERLEEVGAALAGRAGVPVDAMSVGRICTEADASRVNAASVTLELARAAGGAGRLSLDLREVPTFAVFPGQVVGVQGAATGADRLAVTALFTDGAAPYAAAPARNARALAAARRTGGPIRAWVAAGPFTDAKNLDYEPLQELLAEATQAERGAQPDVVVLMGPFVDVDHPLVKAGSVTADGVPASYGEFFHKYGA
jgi:hypothetical protein